MTPGLLTVGDCRGDALTQTEWVPPDEIGAGRIRIVQRVEEKRRAGRKQVVNVLLQRVDLRARRVLGNEAVVVDGVHISFLRDRVAEASAGGVLEGNAPAASLCSSETSF